MLTDSERNYIIRSACKEAGVNVEGVENAHRMGMKERLVKKKYLVERATRATPNIWAEKGQRIYTDEAVHAAQAVGIPREHMSSNYLHGGLGSNAYREFFK